jgi:hypothetical protein
MRVGTQVGTQVGAGVVVLIALGIGMSNLVRYPWWAVHDFPTYVYWLESQWWGVPFVFLPSVAAVAMVVLYQVAYGARLAVVGDWHTLRNGWIDRYLGTRSIDGPNGKLRLVTPEGREALCAASLSLIFHEAVKRLRMHYRARLGWHLVYAELVARWGLFYWILTPERRLELEREIFAAEPALQEAWLAPLLKARDSFAARHDWWYQHKYLPDEKPLVDAGVRADHPAWDDIEGGGARRAQRDQPASGTLQPPVEDDERFGEILGPDDVIDYGSPITVWEAGDDEGEALQRAARVAFDAFVRNVVNKYQLYGPDMGILTVPAEHTVIPEFQNRLGPAFEVFWDPPARAGVHGLVCAKPHLSMTAEITGIPTDPDAWTFIDADVAGEPEWLLAGESQGHRWKITRFWPEDSDAVPPGKVGIRIELIVS